MYLNDKNVIIRKLLQENDQSEYDTIIEKYTELVEVETTLTTTATQFPTTRRTRTKLMDKLITQSTNINVIKTTVDSLEKSRELLDQTAKKLKSTIF
jgi:hypothetical protein